MRSRQGSWSAVGKAWLRRGAGAEYWAQPLCVWNRGRQSSGVPCVPCSSLALPLSLSWCILSASSTSCSWWTGDLSTNIFAGLWSRPCLHPEKLRGVISKPDTHEYNPYLCKNLHMPRLCTAIALVVPLMEIHNRQTFRRTASSLKLRNPFPSRCWRIYQDLMICTPGNLWIWFKGIHGVVINSELPSTNTVQGNNIPAFQSLNGKMN